MAVIHILNIFLSILKKKKLTKNKKKRTVLSISMESILKLEYFYYSFNKIQISGRILQEKNNYNL
jgi:hypothetical protein